MISIVSRKCFYAMPKVQHALNKINRVVLLLFEIDKRQNLHRLIKRTSNQHELHKADLNPPRLEGPHTLSN